MLSYAILGTCYDSDVFVLPFVLYLCGYPRYSTLCIRRQRQFCLRDSLGAAPPAPPPGVRTRAAAQTAAPLAAAAALAPCRLPAGDERDVRLPRDISGPVTIPLGKHSAFVPGAAGAVAGGPSAAAGSGESVFPYAAFEAAAHTPLCP